MKPLLVETPNKTEQELLGRLSKGKPPYNYEKIIFNHNFPRLIKTLDGEITAPNEIEIQPSASCDAHCTFCFAKDYKKFKNKLTNKSEMKKVCDEIIKLDDYYKSKNNTSINVIKFCGTTGEPFTNPQILYGIEYFKNKNKTVRAFSNGLRISKNQNSPEYIEKVALLNILNLSLDAGSTKTLWKLKPGARKGKIKLEEILSAVTKLKDLNLQLIAINYVITNESYNEIVKATKKVKDSGANLIRFRIDMNDSEVSEKHSERILELLNTAEEYQDNSFKVIPIHSADQIKNTKKDCFSSKELGYKCYLPGFWACISPNGNVYSCGHSAHPDSESYGNILEQDLIDIWESDRKKQILANLPGKSCDECPPFGLRTNEFCDYLSKIPIKEIQRIHDKNFSKKDLKN